MPRPLVATIDLSALRHNLSVARHHAQGAKTWAVVKANAYGHGLERAARAFSGADGLALIEPEGAVELRRLGWTKPIALLEGVFDEDDWMTVATHGLQSVVHCREQIDMLQTSGLSGPVDVWLKLNSGMNRLGFQPTAFRKAYGRLRSLPMVRDIGFLTHFANADDPDNQGLSLAEQITCYEQTTAGLSGLRSLSNSAADLMHPAVSADWVRPGIMLYGATPGGASAASFGLRPAMTLETKVIGLQKIEQGDAVGYGSTFIAEGPMTIAVVACGYADGYPRHAPTGTPILVNGVRTRIVGRVSMDMLVADANSIPDLRVGSTVTLWGNGLPIDDVAKAAGTIGYELMCALTRRVKMVERDPV
jgi:alanine racemase